MSQTSRRSRWLLIAAFALFAGAAHAGRVTLFSYNGGGNIGDLSSDDTVSIARGNGSFIGHAAAHQYAGGVGVFASAASHGLNMQAQAFASSNTSFTVNCPLGELDSLTCALDFSMLVSGSAAASHSHDSVNTVMYGTAEAGYTMRWTVSSPTGSLSGGGEVHRYAYDNGHTTEVLIGDPFSSHHLFYVTNGARVTISLQASAGAFTDNAGDGGASAVADFEHTLRWGGINAAFNASGQALDLNQVHLLGDDGYDYVKAAIANPYVSAVPEPETWALMACGLAALAWRRRHP
jgi:hypothetical protein